MYILLKTNIYLFFSPVRALMLRFAVAKTFGATLFFFLELSLLWDLSFGRRNGEEKTTSNEQIQYHA